MRALLRRNAARRRSTRNVASVSGEAHAPALRLLCRRGELAVFDKPAGVLVHPPGADAAWAPTAGAAVCVRRKVCNAQHARRLTRRVTQARYALHEAVTLLGDGPRTLHFVGRLDSGTSGVLAAALSPRAARALQAAWSSPAAVSKEYLVLVARCSSAMLCCCAGAQGRRPTELVLAAAQAPRC